MSAGIPVARRPYYAERVLGALALLLAAEAVTSTTAGDELGVDERTARGLLRALEHAGYATATGGRPRRSQAGPRALALARQAAPVRPCPAQRALLSG